MSNQTTSPSTSEKEVDLQDIFILLKKGFYRCAALFFKAIDFIIKFWWIILLLIIAGYFWGEFSKAENRYKSTLILKINYESQPYVYNAVKQFDKKVNSDADFLAALGAPAEGLGLSEVKIEPIIDVVALMEDIENERTLATIIGEFTEDEEETELFARDRFITNYEYHRLEIEMLTEESKENIQYLLKYINEQPYISELTEIALVNHKAKIEFNEQTLAQITAVMESYAAGLKGSGESGTASFINNEMEFDLQALLEYKTDLVEETAELKSDLVGFDDAVTIISNVQAYQNPSIFSNKKVLYPVLLVGIFLFLAAVYSLYKSLKRRVERYYSRV